MVMTAILLGVLSPGVHGQGPDVLLHTLFSPRLSVQTDTREGSAVAVSARYVVTGAPTSDVQQRDEGVVRVYDAGTSQLLMTIGNPQPLAAEFGSVLAISGDLLVVGTSYAAGNSVYVFDLASTAPAVPVATIAFANPQSVAISGRRIVVGGGGLVHVYDLSSTSPTVPSVRLANPSDCSGSISVSQSQSAGSG
jgi:hypothetical protein